MMESLEAVVEVFWRLLVSIKEPRLWTGCRHALEHRKNACLCEAHSA